MLLGLIAGGWLKSDLPHKTKLKRLLLASAICLALGTALHLLGAGPLVKRIWTPTWTLFSGGLCFLFMAGFYAVIDAHGWKAWSFPLVVIGMNSIAAYCIAHLWDGFIASSLKTHLGQNFSKLFGDTFAPMFQGTAVLLVLWLILFWMYRRKLFLRI
jgi:predicted acyltransferase